MRAKRCPYCGKRISYFSVFASRKKGEITCERCGKNSKVYVSRKIFFVFAVFVLLSLAVMTVFIVMDMLYNPLAIVLVAVPLLIFMLMTPMFVIYEPFKKYKPSMEAKKAGIEYADNLTADEFELTEPAATFTQPKNTAVKDSEIISDDDSFNINSDIFNRIRAERNAARAGLNSDSGEEKTVQEKSVVSVIKNVSEDHASTGAGLKKIHSESHLQNVNRTRHYIHEQGQSEVDKQGDERHRTNENRYSANRKF